MGSNTVFADCAFVFKGSAQLAANLIEELSSILLDNGATIIEPRRDGFLPLEKVTHVVSNTIDFEQYGEAQALMIPVVTHKWISISLYRKKTAATRPFSPDPRMIFSEVVVTCADLPQIDKESIMGACMALGGQESKDLTKLTTHVCALSIDHPKVQSALTKLPRAKIVLPHWFDDCFKLGKRIDETPYLLPDPAILKWNHEDDIDIPDNKNLNGATSADPVWIPLPSDEQSARPSVTVFKGKKIMLASDLNASPRHLQAIRDIIVKGSGIVVDLVDDCDYYIGRYRDGDDYVRAAQSCKHVGNLSWLYHLILRNDWSNPLHKLLHYPIPRHGIEGFEKMKIAVSNYGGESRIYLENLIKTCGAEYTKTMKPENTHLITARDSGEKCKAAPEWNIVVVNHLWIEECYARCEIRPPTVKKFTHFPPRTNLTEVAGQIWLEEPRLRELFYPGGEEAMSPSTKRKRRILEAAEDNAYCLGRAETELDSKTSREPDSAKKVAKKSSEYTTPTRHGSARPGKENETLFTVTVGRSAKSKARDLLQHIAPDIALYEKEKKRQSKVSGSPWGGKRAADLAEKDNLSSKKKPSKKQTEEDDENEQDKEITRPSKKSRPSLPDVEMRIVLTGYPRWLNDRNKEDHDRKKLRDMGVQIVSEGSPCDYVAAPSVVRTVKFLLALTQGASVVDSSFVDAMIDTGKIPRAEDHILKDVEHEKKYSFSLPKSVTRARSNRGNLLAQVPIYCTEKIKNGPDSYKAIAVANGATFIIYRARSGTTIRPTTAEEDDFRSPDPVYLLTNNSPEERQMWQRFKEMAETGHMEPRIVAADWLLDVAMAQEVRFQKKFLAENYFSNQAN